MSDEKFPDHLRPDLNVPQMFKLACEWDGLDPSKTRLETVNWSAENPFARPEVFWKDPYKFLKKYLPPTEGNA